MQKRLFKTYSVLIAMILLLSAVGVGSVSASARTISWIDSITYQNVGTSVAHITIDFYAEGSSTSVASVPLTLNGNAAASLFVGSVSNVPAGFRGSAVMSSDQQIVATVVQFHQNAAGETVKDRLLSNSFSGGDGSSQFLLATVLANTFSRTSVFSVQNTEASTVTATIKFYDLSGTLASTVSYDIPANSSKYVEMDQTGQTGLSSATFNGSAIVTAVLKSDGVSPANVVASENEYYTNKDIGSAFEGLPLSKTATTLYLATALCQSNGLDSFFAVQNASLTTATNITVTYYNKDGTTKTTDGPYNIGKGQKKSIATCAPNSGANMAGFTGSAKVVSDTTPIAAIGRAQGSAGAPTPDNVNMFTAFLGEVGGAAKLTLPFVRFANDADYKSATNYGGYQRVYLAIQNVSSVVGIVDVNYVDKAGNVVKTQTLTVNPLAKANSDASSAGALGLGGMKAGEFGYYTDGTFGGGVVLQLNASSDPNARFIAIARAQNPGAGEDYNGFQIP